MVFIWSTLASVATMIPILHCIALPLSRGIFPSIASELAFRTKHAPCVYVEMRQGSRPNPASGISDCRYLYSPRISQRTLCNKRSIKPSVVIHAVMDGWSSSARAPRKGLSEIRGRVQVSVYAKMENSSSTKYAF